MAKLFSLPHINILPFVEPGTYQGERGGSRSRGLRDRLNHGASLQAQLGAAFDEMDSARAMAADVILQPAEGTYLEIELAPGAGADTLDAKGQNIRAGAVNLLDGEARQVALFVPDNARDSLENLIDSYLTGPLTERGNPPNMSKVEALEAIRPAGIETLWTDERSALPGIGAPCIWWGVWCWKNSEGTVTDTAQKLGLRTAEQDRWLKFPEVVVVPILGTRSDIERIIMSTGGIAELRRASDSPAFFTDHVADEALLWADELAERITWPPSDVPAVCIFDTGVNRAHPLIEPALASADMHTIDAEWGTHDDSDTGHGTMMAGLALHGDLSILLADRSLPVLRHRLESVKIMPPALFDPHKPAAFGPITQEAIARPEITDPDRPRIYCLAITNEFVSGARPSGWSGSIDQAVMGTMPGDALGTPPRLVMVSAGNAPAHIDAAQLRPQSELPIEDPAQAWNAITVGGYTDRIDLLDAGYDSWGPLVSAGELSPHSRTSATWPRNAPLKPEIVMEAGNRGINTSGTEVLTLPSLSLASTGPDVMRNPIVAFQATSAATAQAARLAACLSAEFPEFWPETIRALIVHSAEWTEPMRRALDARASKEARCELIRHFGYGVPDYDRAAASARHHLALFAQTEIQPFLLRGTRRFNECHYYDLPIPRDLLESLDNTSVELKVTLSYFVDPNPGLSANIDPQRYQSHGLRFDLRRVGESVTAFKQRVNPAERPDPKVRPPRIGDDDRWLLGPKSISAGSLHCDVWSGPAIELLGRDMLCIKPVAGWCRDRASKDFCNLQRRYALIVTIKALDSTIDLHTPISNHIENLIGISTPI